MEECRTARCHSRILLQRAQSHHDIPGDLWCVTREDLVELRKLVEEAVAEGRIRPTDRDPFDGKHGPCIYVVVQRLIKPVTAIAGGQSWALMKHPEGLECDLFVTHCWTEGIYEFIDKVLHSWPEGSKHAWCCMLSNPQNFDFSSMGELIACPSESPFAKALQSCKCMLVVPNRNTSIYTRVWCTYEAYLAYHWQKDIYVASYPIPGYWSRIWLSILVALLIAVAIACSTSVSSSKTFVTMESHTVSLWITATIAGVVSISPPGRLWQIVDYVGLLVSAVFLGYYVHEFIGCVRRCSIPGMTLDWCNLLCDVSVLASAVLTYACALLAFGVSEGDRLVTAERMHESVLLRQGFSGHVRDSESSVEKDKHAIMDEIGDLETDVDRCIQVLLSAGTFTHAVREASLHGVKVERVGEFRWSFLVASIGAKMVECIGDMIHLRSNLIKSNFSSPLLFYISMTFGTFEVVVVLSLFAVKPRFRRVFISKAYFKMWLVNALIDITLAEFVEQFDDIWGHAQTIMLIWMWTDALISILTLYVCIVGLSRTVQIPVVGPSLAGFILSTNCDSCLRSCCNCCLYLKLQATSRTDGSQGIELVGALVRVTQAPDHIHGPLACASAIDKPDEQSACGNNDKHRDGTDDVNIGNMMAW